MNRTNHDALAERGVVGDWKEFCSWKMTMRWQRLRGHVLRIEKYEVVRATNGRDAAFLLQNGAFDANRE